MLNNLNVLPLKQTIVDFWVRGILALLLLPPSTGLLDHILLSIQLTNKGIFVQQINFIPQQEGESLMQKISGFINLIVSIFPLLPQLHFRLLAISPVPSAVSNIGWHCTGNFSQAVIRPNLMVHTTIKA